MFADIIAQAVAVARTRDQAGMTPEEIAAADAKRAAECEAWAAGAPEREAQAAAKRAEEARQHYLRTPRHDTLKGPGRPYHLAGRCADGAERDGGRLVHVLPVADSGLCASGTAICGAKPGHRSAGWSDSHTGAATCPRCRKRATLALPHDAD